MPNPLRRSIAVFALLFAAVFLISSSAAERPPRLADRTSLVAALQAKITQKKPLVAHILVPLCDNVNQGIVPVNSSLGNGQNPKSNLYWGAGYGIKTHFQRKGGYTQLTTATPSESHLLDRAVFSRTLPSGAQLLIVADAYDGAYMATAIADFYACLAGAKKGTIQAGTLSIPAFADADLIALNGHNGLMDSEVDVPARKDARARDAVVIACASKGYFLDPLAQLGAYPLLTTTGLLAPEAYVMEAIVSNWAQLKSGAEVRTAAGTAYNTYQKCGIKGATNLFHSGW
jgi:hypothetical protein